MIRDMTKKIIEEEKLSRYDFFDEKSSISDGIVIHKEADKWIVYATEERVCKVICCVVIMYILMRLRRGERKYMI